MWIECVRRPSQPLTVLSARSAEVSIPSSEHVLRSAGAPLRSDRRLASLSVGTVDRVMELVRT